MDDIMGKIGILWYMKKNTEKIFPERLYHIYNRGINGENLFKEERNYPYFLDKYMKFVLPVAHLYAYCLMKNHFHFFIEIKTEEEIRDYFEGKVKNQQDIPIESLISRAFNSFFKSYSVTINKTYSRTGRLFEEPFLRIEVESNRQITNLITYIHHNPQKHSFVNKFDEYPYSSYQDHLDDSPAWLARKQVLNWFGTKEEYKRAHADIEDLPPSQTTSLQELMLLD